MYLILKSEVRFFLITSFSRHSLTNRPSETTLDIAYFNIIFGQIVNFDFSPVALIKLFYISVLA